MKKLGMLALLGFSLFGAACTGPTRLTNDFGATPAYSSRERYTMIGRNWDYEGKQIMDDIDHALLLRGTGHLTIWNVR